MVVRYDTVQLGRPMCIVLQYIGLGKLLIVIRADLTS